MQQSKFSKSTLVKMRKVVLDTALEVGAIQRRYFRKKISIRSKGALGLVTEVDIRSEKLILKRLKKAFPSIGFRAEESSAASQILSDEPMWHIDPLDGTTNYAHGFPMYCVSIGLAIGDDPILGVVHAPSLGETWYGSEGSGAYFNGKKISVSNSQEIKDCLVCTGFSYTKGAKLEQAIKSFHRISEQARAVRRPGAAALDIAYLASGVYDAFWEQGLSSWDICAGMAIAIEAGATLTDFRGKAVSLDQGELLATNAKIHSKMLRLV